MVQLKHRKGIDEGQYPRDLRPVKRKPLRRLESVEFWGRTSRVVPPPAGLTCSSGELGLTTNENARINRNVEQIVHL